MQDIASPFEVLPANPDMPPIGQVVTVVLSDGRELWASRETSGIGEYWREYSSFHKLKQMDVMAWQYLRPADVRELNLGKLMRGLALNIRLALWIGLAFGVLGLLMQYVFPE